MNRSGGLALFMASLLWTLSAVAATFTAQMTPEQVQAEIQAALGNGETLQDIMQQASIAGVDATTLYTAAVNAGIAPGAVVATAQQAGYTSDAINNAIVQAVLSSPTQGSFTPTSNFTGNTGLGSPSGGGGGSAN